MIWLRRLGGWLLASLATTLAGSIAQTQFNLARLGELGVEIPWTARAATTAQDLAGFAPLFAALVGAAFALALPVAGLIRRRWPAGRPHLYALAGAVAIATLLVLMEAHLGLVAIAAARGAGGFLALVLAGALGGWVFARTTPG